jgi:uncharacterized protein (TIGR00725 family)
MVGRRPVIGVMGGSDATEEECERAASFARLVADEGYILLCGGRPAGIMEAAAQAAHAAGGLVIGVLPGTRDDPAEVSSALDVAILTGMGEARDAINVLSSTVVVACSGGPGTIVEIALALKGGRPVVLLGWDGPSRLFPEHMEARQLRVTWTPAEALAEVRRILAREG